MHLRCTCISHQPVLDLLTAPLNNAPENQNSIPNTTIPSLPDRIPAFDSLTSSCNTFDRCVCTMLEESTSGMSVSGRVVLDCCCYPHIFRGFDFISVQSSQHEWSTRSTWSRASLCSSGSGLSLQTRSVPSESINIQDIWNSFMDLPRVVRSLISGFSFFFAQLWWSRTRCWIRIIVQWQCSVFPLVPSAIIDRLLDDCVAFEPRRIDCRNWCRDHESGQRLECRVAIRVHIVFICVQQFH